MKLVINIDEEKLTKILENYSNQKGINIDTVAYVLNGYVEQQEVEFWLKYNTGTLVEFLEKYKTRMH